MRACPSMTFWIALALTISVPAINMGLCEGLSAMHQLKASVYMPVPRSAITKVCSRK